MINWKYIFYILISVLLIGYIFISSKKIDNLKNQLLIEQAKNERVIDSLSFDCKLKEEQITILFNTIEKANHTLDSLYLVKNSIVYKDVPIFNTMINSVETLKNNLCVE